MIPLVARRGHGWPRFSGEGRESVFFTMRTLMALFLLLVVLPPLALARDRVAEARAALSLALSLGCPCGGGGMCTCPDAGCLCDACGCQRCPGKATPTVARTTCPCSAACTCGCQAGQPCSCSSLAVPQTRAGVNGSSRPVSRVAPVLLPPARSFSFRRGGC